jgi:hypothetical protein
VRLGWSCLSVLAGRLDFGGPRAAVDLVRGCWLGGFACCGLGFWCLRVVAVFACGGLSVLAGVACGGLPVLADVCLWRVGRCCVCREVGRCWPVLAGVCLWLVGLSPLCRFPLPGGRFASAAFCFAACSLWWVFCGSPVCYGGGCGGLYGWRLTPQGRLRRRLRRCRFAPPLTCEPPPPWADRLRGQAGACLPCPRNHRAPRVVARAPRVAVVARAARGVRASRAVARAPRGSCPRCARWLSHCAWACRAAYVAPFRVGCVAFGASPCVALGLTSFCRRRSTRPCR